MASQDSFSNLKIYFVVPENYKTENECQEDMWEAYNMCTQNEFQPEWIQEKNCLDFYPQKTDVFVMEEFQGAAFEYLSKSKCLIVGARCLLSCFLSGEPIPGGSSPVFTTAMRGMIVCITGIELEIKESLQKKIEYMGGLYMKQLNDCVTHMISNSVMSVKYEKAMEKNIPILTEGWIHAIWEANLKDFVKADDPEFDEYKCPVFMNLVVTSTNLSKPQKEKVKKSINDHGGTFMGALDGAKVKVVLAPNNCELTDKLKYAKQHNIACLNFEWVAESITAGYALPFIDYLISSTKAGSSTPDKSQAPMLNISTISAIGRPRDSTNFVEETMTNIDTTAMADMTSVDRQSLAPYVARLERLDAREAQLAGPFLDGCNVYLAGFSSHHRDKMNRILNAGSATRLDDISDAVTHVIVGDPSKASGELKLMQSRGLNPHILSLDWLEASLRLRRPAPEEHYADERKRISNPKTAEPPSPLSKKNLQMLQRPKRPPVPQFDIDRETTTEEADDDEEEASLVQQYLKKGNNKNHAAEISFQELLQSNNASIKETPAKKGFIDSENASKTCVSEAGSMVDPANDSAVPYSQSTLTEKMFDGLTFLVSGFDEGQASLVIQNISALGGRLVSHSFIGLPDYGVVPLLGTVLKNTVDEIVTDLFIEDCIDQEKIVAPMYYHRPISIPPNAKPLHGLVITTSAYAGVERIYLTKVANALGAMYQDTFARKTNTERNHFGSTHLLCRVPEGNKYAAAVKWKLPAVTASWLRACTKELRRVDETDYLVGETVAPETSANTSSMGPPSTPTTRTVLTPKRYLPHVQGQATPGCETPLVNKRLCIGPSNTPQSPLHIATPETPYGAIFKENPSPDTRKDWVRWIESFPDLRVEEQPPSPKRRRTSTPMSELRNRFWKAVQVPISTPPTRTDDDVCNDDVNRKEMSASFELPTNRKLSFAGETSVSTNAIDQQIQELDQVLQATGGTTESRYSLSANAKACNDQPRERIDQCMVKESQPDTVGWEDPAHERRVSHTPTDRIVEPVEEEVSAEEPQKLKFMLSGIKDRTSYETVIKKLGGEVSTETNFDPTATHLLCIRPSRNEKMLSSIAAGKWILHCTYLHDCDEEGQFIDEEKYEWGNPLSNNVIPEANGEAEKSLAQAVYRWRSKLNRQPGGAFQEMTALFIVPKEKYEPYARLVKAGGGTVVQTKAPYDSSPGGRKITHCFIQLNKLDQPVDWAMLASKGILCFQPQYLGDYLTATKPTSPRDLVIPEFKKYLALLPK